MIEIHLNLLFIYAQLEYYCSMVYLALKSVPEVWI